MRLPQTARDAIQMEIAGLQAQIDEYQKLLDQDTSQAPTEAPPVPAKGGMSHEARARQKKKLRAYWKKKKADKAAALAAATLSEPESLDTESPTLGESEFSVPIGTPEKGLPLTPGAKGKE